MQLDPVPDPAGPLSMQKGIASVISLRALTFYPMTGNAVFSGRCSWIINSMLQQRGIHCALGRLSQVQKLQTDFRCLLGRAGIR